MIVPWLIVALIVTIFISVVYSMFISEKKRKIKKQESLSALGFYPLQEFDLEMLEKLKSMYQKNEHQEIELKEIYYRHEGDHDLYLYEVWNKSSDDNDLKEEFGLAIRSSHLNLPRFTLAPKITMSGKLAVLANRFLEFLLKDQEQKISFKHHSEFSNRYMIFGKNESIIRQLFKERILNRLSETQYWHVEGTEDLLTFSKFEVAMNQKRGQVTQLEQRLQNIRHLFKWIREENHFHLN
jgi:hypothetical protein